MPENAYCVDQKTFLVTKFDCPCAPSGFERHEFVVDTDNKEEILSKAREIVGEQDVRFCEHF